MKPKVSSVKRSMEGLTSTQANKEKKNKKQREETQVINIIDEARVITIDSLDRKEVMQYYEQLCAHNIDNLDETDQFLKRHKLPTLTKEK